MALSPSTQRSTPSAPTATADRRAMQARPGATIGERKQPAKALTSVEPQAPAPGFLTKVRHFFGISRAEFSPNAQFTTGASPGVGLAVLGNAGRMRPKTSDRDLVSYLDQIAAHGSRAVRPATS